MHMIQFIRPQPRFQIPVSRIAGWLAGCSPELVEMSQFIRSATFERLRMCVHENAHQQIPERCSGLSIFQFRSFALERFQCSHTELHYVGAKTQFPHRESQSSTGRLDGRAAHSSALVCVGRLWILPSPPTRPYVKIQTHKSQHALHWKTSLSQQFTTFRHCKFQVESRKDHVCK